MLKPRGICLAVADPKRLVRGHHLVFGVSNYDEFVKDLKERGLEVLEKTHPDGKTRQVFSFDPVGNGLEELQLHAAQETVLRTLEASTKQISESMVGNEDG